MSTILIRTTQIDLLLGNTNHVIDYFNSLWATLHIIEVDVYHKSGGEFIYYTLNKLGNKEWIFYQDVAASHFWCNYSKYWIVFCVEFDLTYTETQTITKILIDNALKISVESPIAFGLNNYNVIINSNNATVHASRANLWSEIHNVI